jgi:hypothetical protein
VDSKYYHFYLPLDKPPPIPLAGSALHPHPLPSLPAGEGKRVWRILFFPPDKSGGHISGIDIIEEKEL